MQESVFFDRYSDSQKVGWVKQEQYLYAHIYNLLKAQKMILSESIHDFARTDTNEQINMITGTTVQLLNATYSTLFHQAEKSIRIIQNVVAVSSNYDVIKYGERIMKSLLLIKSIQTVFEIPDQNKSESDEEMKSDGSQHVDDQVLCRICERYYPLDQIESHTRACIFTFSQEISNDNVDVKINELITSISDTINITWPGDSSESKKLLLPLLQLNSLLSVLVRENIHNSCSFISRLHKKIKSLCLIMPENTGTHDTLMKASTLSHQKVHICAAQKLPRRREQMTIDDFNLIKQLSGGAYGRVYLATKKTTNEAFAIKAIPRDKLDQKNSAFIEKNVLSGIVSDRVVKLFYTISGVRNLYIVLEYLPGGDLQTLLDKMGSFNEDIIRIYSAQVVKALEDLRKNGIVHRDLKPGNILICKNGQIKLIDFGLSFNGAAERRISVTGTPDYIAPEVVLSMSHSYTADYWSLGVMLFEFVMGVPPFHRDTPEETFLSICSGKLPPIDASEELIDLIKKLLTINPEMRLGYSSVSQIKKHSFFKTIQWDDLDSLEPPFVPDLRTSIDTSYFNSKTHDMTDIISDAENARKRTLSFDERPQTPDANFLSVSVKELARKTFDDARQKQKNIPAFHMRKRNLSFNRITSLSPAPGLMMKSPLEVSGIKRDHL